jgi:DNA-directed RNA polymerase subunit RPC12/RpoP
VLAPGVFIRAGVRCPHCRRRMDSQPEWRAGDSLMDWSYVCHRCGTRLNTNLKIVSSLEVWGLPGKPPLGSPNGGCRRRGLCLTLSSKPLVPPA